MHYYFPTIKYHISLFIAILFCKFFTHISNKFYALFQRIAFFFSFCVFFSRFANFISTLYDFTSNVKLLVTNKILHKKRSKNISYFFFCLNVNYITHSYSTYIIFCYSLNSSFLFSFLSKLNTFSLLILL